MICIRREAAMTKICYESTSTGNDFAVSVGVAAAGTVAAKGTNDPACGYGTIGALNAKGYDHIIIPQPEQLMAMLALALADSVVLTWLCRRRQRWGQCNFPAPFAP